MKQDVEYFIVEADALPEVFKKVMAVKNLLASGKTRTINDAVNEIGISRSAYYKYKDSVFPFFDARVARIITLSLTLEHKPGILSNVLNILAAAGGNILTINQNIPLNQIANVTVSFDTKNMKIKLNELLSKLSAIQGVIRSEIIAEQ
ncbi:MAG: ACT domain-containing protein [Thermoanaerobacteraceae bacterium]|nr:ACT domain-containing protein [Thermoanaerobacteraceae bacterium]